MTDCTILQPRGCCRKYAWAYWQEVPSATGSRRSCSWSHSILQLLHLVLATLPPTFQIMMHSGPHSSVDHAIKTPPLMDLAVSELHWTNSLFNTQLLLFIYYPTFNLYMYTPPPLHKKRWAGLQEPCLFSHALGGLWQPGNTPMVAEQELGCLWLSKNSVIMICTCAVTLLEFIKLIARSWKNTIAVQKSKVWYSFKSVQ